MLEGRIIKGIAGFYYVQTKEGVYACKAKGVFRKEKIKPLVGDRVRIEILDESGKEGNLTEIMARTNQLIRPAAANIDQALVIFSVAMPQPNLNLLDRFLITMERQKIRTIICFNKCDLVDAARIKELRSVYEAAGYEMHFISIKEQSGIEEIRQSAAGMVTVVAGPSGVGKSSLMNALQEHVYMETGSISGRIERGKHTTRHAQLLQIGDESYVMDTPGFSSLAIDDLKPEEVAVYFTEFTLHGMQCRFHGCAHMHEPDCGVKQAVNEGRISRQRYENYLQIYDECKNKRRF